MQRRVKLITIKSNKICMQTHLKKTEFNDFQNQIIITVTVCLLNIIKTKIEEKMETINNEGIQRPRKVNQN
jgi:hypothetical protein